MPYRVVKRSEVYLPRKNVIRNVARRIREIGWVDRFTGVKYGPWPEHRLKKNGERSNDALPIERFASIITADQSAEIFGGVDGDLDPSGNWFLP